MMESLSIRPYIPADWPRLCAIHDAARLDELRPTVGEAAFLPLEQAAENEGLFDGRVDVAELDGVVEGFIAYTDDEITWVYINPLLYRRGIGRVLVRHALTAAGPVMRLEVLEGNEAALRFYLAEGFKVVRRSEGRLAGNETFAAVGLVMEYNPAQLANTDGVLPQEGDKSMIVIHAYDPHWPGEFESIRQDLLATLEPLAQRIDHIGSTAVPGLGAKDVIDVQVTVEHLSPAIIERMTAAGYQHSEHRFDHVPPGEDAAPERWAKLLFTQPEGQRRAHIHVRVAGRPNQHYPLLFRDYLRAHPRSAAAIERIKRELARYHADDVEAYYDIKDPVYDLVWDAAQEWARLTDYDPG